MSVPINVTSLPTRAKNVLKRLDAKTVGDITKLKRSEILRAKWAGKKVLAYIEEFLSMRGLTLTPEENGPVVEKGFPLLNAFNSIEKQIFDYFGYREDWVKIPMEDRTEMYWMLQQNDNGGGSVTYFEEPITEEILNDGKCYRDSIYTQRFLPKWVYPGKDYTMIVVDTHTDGNKFLAIFDNKKQVTMSAGLVSANRRWDLYGDHGVPLDMVEK